MQLRQRIFIIGFNVYTALLWAWYVVTFLTKGALEMPRPFVDLYLIVLTFYAGDKEIRRWRRQHFSSTKIGELVVGGWITTFVIVAAVELAGGASRGYRIPEGLELIVGVVVAIFVITEYLKTEFRKKRR